MIVFNEAKPKYEKLDELLENQLLDIRFTNSVNVIIDVKELSKKFFRPDVIVDDKNRGNLITEISSDIINTIGHYRNFFYKHKKYTTFYFLYSYEECSAFKDVFPGYKKEYYEKYINGTDEKVPVIKKAINSVEKVINKVIPNAYFVRCDDYDEFVNTRYILENIIQSNQLTLIISNDDIFYQLVKDNVAILQPKGIRSELLTHNNVVKVLAEDENVDLSYNSLPAIYALSGIKRYSFKSLPKVAVKKAINTLEKLKERGLFTDLNSITVPIDFDKLDVKKPFEKNIYDHKDMICEMYDLIRADNILYKNKVMLASKYQGLQTARYPRYFGELNSKIYSMYPLSTDMILKGEKI